MSKWFSIHQTSTNYDLVALIIETSEYWPTWSCKERESHNTSSGLLVGFIIIIFVWNLFVGFKCLVRFLSIHSPYLSYDAKCFKQCIQECFVNARMKSLHMCFRLPHWLSRFYYVWHWVLPKLFWRVFHTSWNNTKAMFASLYVQLLQTSESSTQRSRSSSLNTNFGYGVN